MRYGPAAAQKYLGLVPRGAGFNLGSVGKYHERLKAPKINHVEAAQ